MTRRRSNQLIFGVLLACGSVALTVLVLEIGLRIFYPGIGALRAILTPAPGDDSRAYVLTPGAQVAFTGLHERLKTPADWRINAAGIRSDRQMPPVSGKFRIATFGDSETFGWSVRIAETFQRRMEKIDARVEVINFGTPGYNIENVADLMQARLPGLRADMVIYLFHKNDLDPPLTFSAGLGRSRLYLLWRKSRERIMGHFRPEAKEGSMSADRLALLARHIERMTALARRENAPLLIGLMDARYRDALPGEVRRSCYPRRGVPPCARRGEPFWAGSLDIDRIRNKRDRVDGHIPAAGHREIAELLCRVIAGGNEGSCVPPGWR